MTTSRGVETPAAAEVYDALSEDEQVDALRGVAQTAAPRFGVQPDRCDLLLHGFNTTFAVTGADGSKVAVRVLTNSVSTSAHIVAQHAWMRDLTGTTTVRVPDPRRSLEGTEFVEVRSDPLARSFVVTMASWLDGPDLSAFDPASTRALGQAMATMHVHAQGFLVPVGGAVPVFSEPLFGDEDHLRDCELFTGDGADVVRRALEVAQTAYDRLVPDADLVLIHGDLHAGNLKWQDGRLAVFDFDDCGRSLPVVDLATTMIYLRDEFPGAEETLRAGYAEVRPLPEVAPETFEALIASRQLLLANSLLATSTASLRAEVAAYLPIVVERLRHWQDTGRFTRSLS